MSRTITAAGPRAGDLGAGAAAPTVGMVGAGQLARMTHQAAIALGVTVRVLAVSAGDPAARAGAPSLIGSPDDLDDLRALAAGADVVTFDHERIPPEHLHALQAGGVRVEPSPEAKLLAQDKLHARRELAARGFPLRRYARLAARRQGAEGRLRRPRGRLAGGSPRGAGGAPPSPRRAADRTGARARW
jgi:5-(carboxyamino)imidazole ribonucleotide synthase